MRRGHQSGERERRRLLRKRNRVIVYELSCLVIGRLVERADIGGARKLDLGDGALAEVFDAYLSALTEPIIVWAATVL